MSDSVWRDILYTIGFDDEEVDEIEQCAQANNTSVTGLICHAIDFIVWG